jgi:hypothetical protein
MIDRSQTTDPRATSTLLNRALRLLKSRSRCILDRQEKSGVYYGLVQVSELQLHLGQTPSINSDERIALARESLSMSDHYDRCEIAVSLVLSLIALADERKDCRLLDEAESIVDQELRSKSIFHANLIAAKAELSVALYSLSGVRESLGIAWDLYKSAVTNTTERARDRFRLALRWATSAEQHTCPSQALEAYTYAVQLLPRVAFLDRDVFGRMQALRDARGLSYRAAALALSVGRTHKAVELLEQSRGIIWSQSLHLRTPSNILPSEYAAVVTDLCQKLENNDGLD